MQLMHCKGNSSIIFYRTFFATCRNTLWTVSEVLKVNCQDRSRPTNKERNLDFWKSNGNALICAKREGERETAVAATRIATAPPRWHDITKLWNSCKVS